MSQQLLSLDSLDEWCAQLVKNFSKKQILLLDGPLGAGKTELVNKIVSCFGEAQASSPTYSLIHEYEVGNGKKIVHVDLYRLESEEDLESIGFWDLFEEVEGLIIVEWACKLSEQVWPIHWGKTSIGIEVPNDTSLRLYKVD